MLVHFYAGWCQPCHQLLPVLKDTKGVLKENIRIIKVNAEENPAIVSRYRIQNLPTLILFQSGNVKWMNEGVLNSVELTNILRKFLP